MTAFWSAWIIVLTTITLILLVWLLFATRKIKTTRTDNTTGHVYDGIVESDNPLPSWWFNMFVISIVFAVGYLIAYPGMGSFSGMLNWTSVNEHDQRAQQIADSFRASVAEFEGLKIPELAVNKKARNMGRRLFASNCSVCHGNVGEGGFGFPNLTDSNWQWGGSTEQILQTIKHGRTAAMPAWKDILGPQKLPLVVNYVRSLSGLNESTDKHTTTNKTGETLFKTYCVSCHGALAQGNPILGTPSLADDVWLYGSSEEQILLSISAGRAGQMPAHNELLGDVKINLIAGYVYSLSHP